MKKNYTYPEICVLSVVVENGFANTYNSSIGDYNMGENDKLDD